MPSVGKFGGRLGSFLQAGSAMPRLQQALRVCVAGLVLVSVSPRHLRARALAQSADSAASRPPGVGTTALAAPAEPSARAEPSSGAARAAAATLAGELERGEHAGMAGFAMSVAGVGLPGHAPTGSSDLRSATKSITALLVGIAIDRGEIPSVDARVIDLLPEYARELGSDPRKAEMTIHHLLTMQSGLDCDDWDKRSPGHEDKMYRRRDWLEFWARQEMRDAPGTRFSYCTGNAVALGRILAHATGMQVDRYAEAVLFAPLGIAGAKWETWNRGADVDTGGHLRLAPQGLLRLGELLIRSGRRGEGPDSGQIVSAEWIARMTTAHTAIPGRQESYGYLWWLNETSSPGLPKTRLQMAWGNGGNYLIVMPELRAVVVFTGTRFNRPEALEPLFWLRDRLLPALAAPGAP